MHMSDVNLTGQKVSTYVNLLIVDLFRKLSLLILVFDLYAVGDVWTDLDISPEPPYHNLVLGFFLQSVKDI